MAWQRTALGVGGVSALLLHESSTVAEAVPGVLGLMLTLLLIVLAEARYDQTVRHIVAGESPVNGRLVRLLATGTVLLAVSTLALAAVEAPA
jgi:putative membrane protein